MDLINYYQILGLHSFENKQDLILEAYRIKTERTLKLNSEKEEIYKKLLLINEAYLVLKDSELKIIYDYDLSRNVITDNLKERIIEKQNKAKDFINEKENLIPKNNKHKKRNKIWKITGWSFLIIIILTPIIFGILYTEITSRPDTPVKFKISEIPSTWETYNFKNFSISMPPDFILSESQGIVEGTNVNENPDDAFIFESYNNQNDFLASVCIVYEKTVYGDIKFTPQDSPHLNPYDLIDIKNEFKKSLGLGYIVEIDNYRWIRFNETNALELPCKIKSIDFENNINLYILFNGERNVIIGTQIGDINKSIIQIELLKIVSSFKWK